MRGKRSLARRTSSLLLAIEFAWRRTPHVCFQRICRRIDIEIDLRTFRFPLDLRGTAPRESQPGSSIVESSLTYLRLTSESWAAGSWLDAVALREPFWFTCERQKSKQGYLDSAALLFSSLLNFVFKAYGTRQIPQTLREVVANSPCSHAISFSGYCRGFSRDFDVIGVGKQPLSYRMLALKL